MKIRFTHMLTALVFAGFSSTTLAVQITAEDVSNKIIMCAGDADPLLSTRPAGMNSLLSTLSPGTCLAVPEATLNITVKLEANDKPTVLENVHLVVESNGEYFQYNTRSDGTEEGSKLWKKISVNGLVGASPLTSSFLRGPFDTDNSFMIRQVSLGEFYSQKGAKVYVGVRANDTAGFAADSIKEVYEVR